jgi:hypothetical protein
MPSSTPSSEELPCSTASAPAPPGGRPGLRTARSGRRPRRWAS